MRQIIETQAMQRQQLAEIMAGIRETNTSLTALREANAVLVEDVGALTVVVQRVHNDVAALRTQNGVVSAIYSAAILCKRLTFRSTA